MTPEPRPLVSVVLSFRNEAENLPILIARLDRMFAGEPVEYELIFVNDASLDASLDLLLDARAANPRIKIITMSRRFGVAECVRAGLTAARGDAVIYMDADLQDPPEVIPAMLSAWRAGADVVNTVRTRREGGDRVKIWLTGLAYRLIRRVATIDLPIEAGDFKLLSRLAVNRVIGLRESDPYLRGLVTWIGLTQVSVPYRRAARQLGETHFPFFSRNPWKTFVVGLTSFSFFPIYVCALLAGIGLVAAAGLALATLVLALRSSPYVLVVGLTGLATFFWATLMLGVCAVGVYVIRVYKDVRGRPDYVVASSVGLTAADESRPAEPAAAQPRLRTH